VRCGLVFWGGNINFEYIKIKGKYFDQRSVRLDMTIVLKEGLVICTGHLMLLGWYGKIDRWRQEMLAEFWRNNFGT
jgi:hypothetical protein